MPLPLSDPSHIINKLTSHIINKLTKDNSSSFKTMSLFNIKKKKNLKWHRLIFLLKNQTEF